MTDLRLGAPFSDHLVLTRDRTNPIWGWDRPGERVTLTVREQGASVSTTETRAAADGSFTLSCPALPAGGPYEIEITGSTALTLRDVLSGEVWLASGQSNMEWPVAAAQDAEREIASAHFPAIRQIKIARNASRKPLREAAGAWRVCAPDTVAEFSAVGYFFARDLHARLGVPIGIIDATWGGTSIDAWLSLEALREVDPSVDARLAELAAQDADLPRIRAEYEAALSAWERASFPQDPPNVGFERGYASLGFDASAWPTLDLPTFWQRHGLRFNGVVWFRREVELPSGGESDLWIELGAIDDFDHTYFNGTLIGSHPDGTPNAFQLKRRYFVPKALVRRGKNLIAVRVFDHFGEGGFVGPKQALFVASSNDDSDRTPLAGPWRYFVEHEIPLVSGDVFATWPPAPAALALETAPAGLFNGMLAPLLPYGLRGVIWYQGETDADRHEGYAARFRGFIRAVRRHFADESLWFLFVQLAGWRAGGTWPLLRDAQAAALVEPHTAMVTAIDIGDASDIHPKNKQEVGRRLALVARANAYGEQELEADGPMLERVALEGTRVVVHLRHARGLRARENGALRGFELAGKDGLFHAASAQILGQSVIVESNAAPEPAAVRYAWADFPDATLENAAGLPALPFRWAPSAARPAQAPAEGPAIERRGA